jgi:hypothetical protein
MPVLDITQALAFLDMLDSGARHTIASEAPFGRNGGPKWEQGATFEPEQREWLIKDIQERQARRSNVYYGVNRPCSAANQEGSYGKCNVDDIIAIRALAFDIDFFTNAELINSKLEGALKPSVIINTGGGLHLIYLLKQVINVNLYRVSPSNEQERINALLRDMRASVSQLAQDFEALLRSIFPTLKIDNMSNVDRVMRLPGTINYPKAEKLAKGQVEALAHIALDNRIKCDPRQLRLNVPRLAPQRTPTQKFKAPKDSQWPPSRKAMTLCEFIRDNGLADSNEIYTHWVMLPLIGMIHDDDENNRITLEEAEDCFLEAISGGERYGSAGRGQGYFRRQWRSHRPELKRNGTRSIGSLIKFCQDNGMKLPWSNAVVSWEKDFERQRQELQEVSTKLTDDDVITLRSLVNVKR